MFHRRAALALSLLFFLNSLLLCHAAANCYLSPTGSDANPCKPNTPCQTINQCFVQFNSSSNITISLGQGTYTGELNCNIQVGLGSIYDNIASLVVQAMPNNTVTIDCSGTGSPHFVFDSSPDLTVTLSGINLINGIADSGGCIYADKIGELTIQNMAFENCHAHAFGGGIYANFPVSILDATFTSCNATNGGALYLTADSSITKCTITNGTAVYGGGIYVTSNSLSLTNSNITFNTAQQLGGGLYLSPPQANTVGSYNFAGTNISSNFAVNGGGGLYATNTNYTWNIYGATFINNNSTNNGDPNIMCDNVTATLFCWSCDAKDCSSDCAPANNNQSCSQTSSTVKCYTTKYSTCSATDSCTCQASGLPKSAKILIILIAICLFVGVVLIVADVIRHFVRKSRNSSGYTPIK